jgi:predicted peptidase
MPAYRVHTIIPAIAAAAALLFASPASAETGFLDRTVQIRGQTYRYQVYVPAEHSSERAWPIIVELHGNGAQGTDGLFQTTGGLAAQVRRNRSRFPTIVLFPQCQPGKRWTQPEMEELVMAELDHTIEEFRGDPGRVYLTGYSMGAIGAFRIASRWPERFAAMATISTRVQSSEGGSAEETALDRRTHPFTAASDQFAALAAVLVGIPVWLFHGDSDKVIAVDESRRMVAALRNAGAEHRYTEYPGADHVVTAFKAYAEEELVPWLLTHRRVRRKE